MRRIKASDAIIKTVTLSAAVAALSTGSFLTANAAQTSGIVRVVQPDGKSYVDINISDLSTNSTYLKTVTDTFMAAGQMYVLDDSTGKNGTEFSATARANNYNNPTNPTNRGIFVNANDSALPVMNPVYL
jgi:hypothetical protein